MVGRRSILRSRREAVHKQRERVLIAKIVLFASLSVVVLYGLVVYGIPTMVGAADAWLQVRDANSTTSNEQPVILATPSLPAPENDYVNKKEYSITGSSESGAKIALVLNDKPAGATLTTDDGRFTFGSINLEEGKNVYFVYRVDDRGNESADSAKREVVLDTQTPNIEVKAPFSGQSFKGQSQRVVDVTGVTSGADSVYVNDNFVILGDDGSFTYRYPLAPGENAIKIKAKDVAGNESVEVTRTVRWEE